jgi:hypothetical protein
MVSLVAGRFFAQGLEFLWNFALLMLEKRLKTGSRKSGDLVSCLL